MTDNKFDEIMARLNPRTRSRIVAANSIEDERLRLPSIGITRALEGGLRYRSQNLIWGNKSSGKSALMYGAIAQAQRDGHVTAIIDAEGAFEHEWAGRMGVDVEHLQVSHVNTTHQANEAMQDLIASGFGFIGLDSVSQLLPGSYFDENGALKDIEATGQIGQFSKDVKRILSMTSYNLAERKSQACVVYISQMSNKITRQGAWSEPMGGFAMEHVPSTIIKVVTPNSEKEALTAKVRHGDYIFEKPVGAKVTWLLSKARGKGIKQSGEYNFYFDGDFVGIDVVAEVMELGVLMGVVEKSGNWYVLGGEKFNGSAKAARHLRDNPELYEQIERDVLSI